MRERRGRPPRIEDAADEGLRTAGFGGLVAFLSMQVAAGKTAGEAREIILRETTARPSERLVQHWIATKVPGLKKEVCAA